MQNVQQHKNSRTAATDINIKYTVVLRKDVGGTIVTEGVEDEIDLDVYAVLVIK